MVYNAVQALDLTMHSILNQVYRDYEWIVIDGGSTDGSVELLETNSEHIAYWVSEPDKGIYDAMNKGIKQASGDYVTFLNAGDYYCNNKVLQDLFSGNDNAHIVYGDILVIAENETPARYQKAMEFNKDLLLAHGTAVLCHQALFVRRDISPFYKTSYKYKAELNWYFDIVESNPRLVYHYVNIPIVYYSLGGLGYTNYLSNLCDLCKLIIMRFGFRTFFKFRYPRIIWNKLKYRYPRIFK